MTRRRDRFFALIGALFFLITASALTISIIVSAVTSKNKDKPASSQTTTPNAKSSTVLAGTKLAGFTPTSNVPKLVITDTKAGQGQTVKTGDTVVVDYTGAVAATGVIFQSSRDSGQPVSLTISAGSVIDGWVQGIPGMKIGGTRRLLIPANLAYGADPPTGSNIPANAPLVFDITLYSIGK